MKLFLSGSLCLLISTLSVAAAACLTKPAIQPRPKPGREPASWQKSDYNLPLFITFPSLKRAVGYARLGLLPTPLEEQPALASSLQIEKLLVKRDDQAAPLFGGAKVRKLEFLLGDACTKNADHIVTWGSPDTTHTSATAVYCSHLKKPCTCMYVFNPQAPVNPNHASLAKAHGAIEETYRGPGERLQALHIKNKAALATTGKALYLVPEGASDVLGALGFVNAVGEVASQLAERGEPFPDVVYLLTGTGGSAAGFLAGLDVFGVKTQPVLVALTPDAYPGQQQGRITALYAMVMEYVSLLEPSITKRNEPAIAPAYDHGFNQSSNASLQEITSTTQQLLLNQASYHLDASFGARLWGAFLLDATHGKLAHKHVMIWNTSPL